MRQTAQLYSANAKYIQKRIRSALVEFLENLDSGKIQYVVGGIKLVTRTKYWFAACDAGAKTFQWIIDLACEHLPLVQVVRAVATDSFIEALESGSFIHRVPDFLRTRYEIRKFAISKEVKKAIVWTLWPRAMKAYTIDPGVFHAPVGGKSGSSKSLWMKFCKMCFLSCSRPADEPGRQVRLTAAHLLNTLEATPRKHVLEWYGVIFSFPKVVVDDQVMKFLENVERAEQKRRCRAMTIVSLEISGLPWNLNDPDTIRHICSYA